MRRKCTLILFAFLLLNVFSTNAFGQGLNLRKTTVLPKAVKNFLNSKEGKKYSEAQFVDAINKSASAPKYAPSNLEFTTVLNEDFSKWTAGSEGNYDTEDVSLNPSKLSSLMNYPGDWSGLYTYQAGGMMYLGSDLVNGPGYLKSPAIDLRGKQGLYRIKLRARTDNPNNTQQMLQIFSFNEASTSIISAEAKQFDSNWTDLEWTFAGGAEQTSIMLYGNSGDIYVDDFTVESVTYPLNSPAITSVTLADVDKVKVEWTAVDGATSYYVYVLDSEDNSLLDEQTVTDTETFLNFIPKGDNYYHIYVIAKDGENESYPTAWWGQLEPESIATPVALPATNISDNGFTANWEKATNASQYILAVTQEHVATSDNETFTIFDDDFSSLNDADMNNPAIVAQLGYCDKYFKRGGWYGDLIAGFSGMIALTNIYADAGLPGSLTSPKMNLGVGDEKVNISGFTASMVDDAVLSIALVKNNQVVDEETVNVSTSGGTFDVELSGGSDDSQIYMSIADASPDGDFIFLDNMKITCTMNKGEIIKLPYTTYYVPYTETSHNVEMPFTGEDKAYYNVQGYFSDEMKSDVSNDITVSRTTGIAELSDAAEKASVTLTEGGVAISNPKAAKIYIYSINGGMVAKDLTGTTHTTVALPAGSYIVRVGNDIFKIMR